MKHTYARPWNARVDKKGLLLNDDGTHAIVCNTRKRIRRRDAVLIDDVVYNLHDINIRDRQISNILSSNDCYHINNWQNEYRLLRMLRKHPLDVDVLLDWIWLLGGRLLLKSLMHNNHHSGPDENIHILIPGHQDPKIIAKMYNSFWHGDKNDQESQLFRDHTEYRYGNIFIMQLNPCVCMDNFSLTNFPQIFDVDEVYHDGDIFQSIGSVNEMSNVRASLSRYMKSLAKTDPLVFIQEFRLSIFELCSSRDIMLDEYVLSDFLYKLHPNRTGKMRNHDFEVIARNYNMMMDELEWTFFDKFKIGSREFLRAPTIIDLGSPSNSSEYHIIKYGENIDTQCVHALRAVAKDEAKQNVKEAANNVALLAKKATWVTKNGFEAHADVFLSEGISSLLAILISLKHSFNATSVRPVGTSLESFKSLNDWKLETINVTLPIMCDAEIFAEILVRFYPLNDRDISLNYKVLNGNDESFNEFCKVKNEHGCDILAKSGRDFTWFIPETHAMHLHFKPKLVKSMLASASGTQSFHFGEILLGGEFIDESLVSLFQKWIHIYDQHAILSVTKPKRKNAKLKD